MKFEIKNNPWNFPYAPKAEAEFSRDEDGFNIMLRAYETEIRFVNDGRNLPVYQDSCLEFFFSPFTGEKRPYFNFEINPLGSLYTGFSADGTRAGSGPVAGELPGDYFRIKSMSKSDAENFSGPYWEVSYHVPFEYMEKFLPEVNFRELKEITANFYKCGDLTSNEHYLSWNNIETETPDFHVPEYFGHIKL